MTKKKKTFLIFGAILLALLVILITLVLIFHEGYLQKTDYDHVSEVAYNDVRIVGRNGLFYLMKNGKIIEKGTHNELLQSRGFYYELYNSQFAK